MSKETENKYSKEQLDAYRKKGDVKSYVSGKNSLKDYFLYSTKTIKDGVGNPLYKSKGTLQGVIEKAVKDNVRLEKANLEGMTFDSVKLQKGVFAGANLKRTSFVVANFEGANFEGANFKEAIFFETDLKKSNLKRANFEGANFNGIWLNNANLEKSSFKQVKIEKGYISKANLQEADFEGASLININFSESNFEGANFKNANLYKLSFGESNLKGTNFVNANFEETSLYNATVEGADFKGVNFENAYLKGVDLTKIKNYQETIGTIKNLDKAKEVDPKVLADWNKAQKVNVVMAKIVAGKANSK